MNECTWLTSDDPVKMLAAMYPMRGMDSMPPQTRKCRLYLLACARGQWKRLPPVCRKLVELAEQYADSLPDEQPLWQVLGRVAEQLMHSGGTPDDLADAIAALAALGHPVSPDGEAAPCLRRSAKSWRELAALVYLPFDMKTPQLKWVPRRFHSADLLREVLGNPYQYQQFSPLWRTSTAVTLAGQMYGSHDFSLMPILAEALQDAGCDDDHILDHCRDRKQTHVRGCWVVDLVLNKK
jgi:hypothetical protein